MDKLIPLAAIAAVAALGACTTPPPQSGPSPATSYMTNVHPYKAGNGTVQSVFATPSAGSAAAGSSTEPTQRLEIKMDGGSIQYVDTPSRDFAKGTRVTLTEDKLIRKM